MAWVAACAWTPRRERAIVGAFAERFVDVAATAAAPVAATVVPEGWAGWGDEEPDDVVEVRDLAAALDLGLVGRRSCRLDLPAQTPWRSAHVAFTVEGGVALGVALADPLDDPVTLQRATALLGELMVLGRGTHGWLAVDRPPPLDPGLERPWRTAPHAIVTG